MSEECPRCKVEMKIEWQRKEYKVCPACFRADQDWYPKHGKFDREIKQYMASQIKELRTMVSLSRKGKPHKQASGFHIATP